MGGFFPICLGAAIFLIFFFFFVFFVLALLAAVIFVPVFTVARRARLVAVGGARIVVARRRGRPVGLTGSRFAGFWRVSGRWA